MKKVQKNQRPWLVLVLCCMSAMFVAAKDPDAASSVTFLKTTVTTDLITLSTTGKFARFDLEVRGPDGFYYQESFDGLAMPFIETFDPEGKAMEDGLYFYEVVGVPILSDEARAAKTAARESGDMTAIRSLQKKGVMPKEGSRQSGTFRILNGSIVLPDAMEMHLEAAFAPEEKFDPREVDYGRKPGAEKPYDPRPDEKGAPVDEGKSDFDEERRDQVIADDLIVDGSACIGFDCVNGESFGFDTIRLKENNLRIKFDDTSVAASFPRTDWQLTANASANGGASKFSIDDISGGRTPFTVEANAPSNALYVDDGGRLGLGTSIPVADVHIIDGDTPTLRLQQDGSSGFAPQTWDVAGNETSFFIRDASNGSTLPFRIRPGAPSQSLVIDTDGQIGVGILTAEADLHMRDTVNPIQFLMDGEEPTFLIERTSGTTDNGVIMMDLINNGQVNLRYNNNNGGVNRRWNTGVDASNQYFISAAGTGAFEFLLETNGNLTLTGTVTAPSDVNMKHDFEPVSPEEVLAKVMDLPLAVWSYKHDATNERHMGPMAQDFYAAFGLGKDERHISYTDSTGVALGAIQGLARQLEEKDARIAELESTLKALIAAQEARIKQLESQINQ